jgi:hypothetical protein
MTGIEPAKEGYGMSFMKKIITAAACVVTLAVLVSCEAGAFGMREQRSVRDVSGFDSVSFATSGELCITQGDHEGLEVSGRASDLPSLITEVRDGTLFIGREGAGPFIELRPPVFTLTVRTIHGLTAAGSGSIRVKNLSTEALTVRISSSGGVALESLQADALEATLCSSGSLRATGAVGALSIRLSSSGGYSGGRLDSRKTSVRVSSSGSATLRASESLEAHLTSSGDVWYFGSPQRVDRQVTSSGSLVRLGN